MNIYSFTKNELENYLIENEFKKFNATQILEWVYLKNIKSFDEMRNVSKVLIEFCKTNFTMETLKLITKHLSKDTVKYLFELTDGNKIECVLMKHNYGNSLCISSQVGCNMGCVFCESGRLKKVRDLSLEELVLQVISVKKEENININSIVIMGIGEPFDNFENIKRFLSVAIDPKMIGIGQRHITVSTCGLVPKIKEFADLDTQVNLAISLHAPNNEIRNQIMKINSAYNINSVMSAVDYYIEKTNRRVTIEYIMLDDINDSEKCAKELVSLLKGKLVYVNLIPYNETSNCQIKRSKDFKVKAFYDILKKNGIECTIRKEMGLKVSAACGQLRALSEVK